MRFILFCLFLPFCAVGMMADSHGQEGISHEGVNKTPLPVHATRAFPNLKIDRPINVINAGDGSGRLFIGGQKGKIYFIDPKNEQVEEPTLFMDMSKKVKYQDRQNEEGLLGIAFHPKFKDNGEFFVYYTTTAEPLLSTISRFKTSTNDRNSADPESEEILLTIKQPAWNHNGGTILFGPDGYLYIGLGDGGGANDPQRNGQNLSTHLGKILRIDVDHQDAGLKYAIPKDNPFINTQSARPEIFALGVRNVWRMSFDRATNDFWVADVGQDKWEEINIVTKGGNYGWSLREAAHRFYQDDSTDVSKLIDPIWEYPHTMNNTWGRSITGGFVYRGKQVPSLVGYYLYSDAVSGNLWALKYDKAAKKVTENRVIPWETPVPVMTFGEDEQGEVYFATTNNGGLLFRFVEGN